MAITAKQQQVLDLVNEGKSIAEIADTMDVTNQAIYGHISSLRKKGIDLSPKSGLTLDPEPDDLSDERYDQADSNGSIFDLDDMLMSLHDEITDKLGTIEEARQLAQQQLDRLDSARTALVDARDRLND